MVAICTETPLNSLLASSEARVTFYFSLVKQHKNHEMQ